MRLIDDEVCLWDRAVTGLAGLLLCLLTPRSRARVHVRLLSGTGVPADRMPPELVATAALPRAAGT